MNQSGHLPAGTRLNDIYEIEDHIADGGIGTVYRARGIDSGELVAIKVLLAQFARDQLILDLFKREAQILRKLKHDALTQYFVFTKEPTLGVHYLAMEFVDGPSLGKRLEGGPLNVDATYALVKRVAAGLQAVHEREVIHRDLSPDNIILQNSDVGQAKIIDFGISRADVGNGTIIGDGFAGKINYVSPEQLGLFDAKVTARSDIYSLGLVIAETLTGRQINMGGTQAQMIEKRRVVPPLEGIDLRFRPLLEAMLQPNPADRPASMTEILGWTLGAPMQTGAGDKTLIQIRAPAPEVEPDERIEERRPSWTRRVVIALSLLGFAGLGAGGAYIIADPGVMESSNRQTQVTQPGSTVAPPSKPQSPPPLSAGTTTGAGSGTAGATQPEKQPPASSAGNRLEVPPLPATQPEPKPVEPPPTPPSLPPVTSPPATSPPVTGNPPIPATPADDIRNFVDSYKVADCTYLRVVNATDTSAAVEAFSSTMGPLEAFYGDFKAKYKFEPDVTVGLISNTQCPTATFLRATPSVALKSHFTINLVSTVVGLGERLSGKIEGHDISRGKPILVLVTGDGLVHDLSGSVSINGQDTTFSANLSNVKRSPDETGIVIAMQGQPGLAQEISAASGQKAETLLPKLTKDVSVLRTTATLVRINR